MKTRTLLFIIVLLVASPSYATIALVTHAIGQSANGNDVTSGTFDSSGGNLIVVYVASIDTSGSLTVQDNKSNSYSACGGQTTGPDNTAGQLFYSTPGTVGSGHTVNTATSTGSVPSIAVLVFSGATTSSPCDQTAGAFSTGTQTLAVGPITPSANNAVIVSGLTYDAANSASVDSGMTISDQAQIIGGQAFGIALAYLVQTSASMITVTWDSGAGFTAKSERLADFKASVATGGGGLLSLGVGK